MKNLRYVALFMILGLCSLKVHAQIRSNIGVQLVPRNYLGTTKIPGIFYEGKTPFLSDIIGNDAFQTGGYVGYGQYGDDYYNVHLASFGALASIHPLEFIEGMDARIFDVYAKVTTGYNWYILSDEFSSFGGLNAFYTGGAIGAELKMGKFAVFAEVGRHQQSLLQVGFGFGGR